MTSTIGNFKSQPRRLSQLAAAFREDESGATAIEYGLIVSLIFLAIVGAVKAYTSSTSDMYGEVSTTLTE